MEDITGGAGKLRLQREKGGEKEDSDRKNRRKTGWKKSAGNRKKDLIWKEKHRKSGREGRIRCRKTAQTIEILRSDHDA